MIHLFSVLPYPLWLIASISYCIHCFNVCASACLHRFNFLLPPLYQCFHFSCSGIQAHVRISVSIWDQASEHPSIGLVLVIMAMAIQLHSFAQLEDILARANVQDYDWIRMTLTGLSLIETIRDDGTRWVAIRVTEVQLEGVPMILSPAHLEAHISLGTWTPNNSWARQFGRAMQRLPQTGLLNMELKLNSEVTPWSPIARLLVFKFNVSCVAGQTLTMLEQTLSAGGSTTCHRARSPRGPVFHVSVRSWN